MKNDIFYLVSKTGYRRVVFISLIISVLIFTDNIAIAQQTKENSARLSFTMNLSSMVSNGTRSMKVLATRKENKKTIMVDDLKSPLNLYLTEVKEHDSGNGTGWISKCYLNNEGEGIFIFPGWFNKLGDSLHEYTFIVKMNADQKYEDAEEQITVVDAKINLEYSGEDSPKTVAASLSGWKDEAYVTVPGADLKLCIKRTFNFLPFGDASLTTDEKGEISGELPLDIPGNANGTITIAARLEDDERYGTVEVTKDVPWAVLPKVNPEKGRTLWSPGDNAPLLLVISSVTIIVIIWGTILYLIYLLFKIKKLGKAT
jgi:hypothetical protein